MPAGSQRYQFPKCRLEAGDTKFQNAGWKPGDTSFQNAGWKPAVPVPPQA
ncbi:MAG: hypothetical protein LLF76_10485 [Planctomycetaceae bacterium]|nr:hypothetical protein [Planctomycetaceae bacterium]